MNASRLFATPPPRGWSGYGFAFTACLAATLIGLPFRERIDAENVVVLYLVAIVLAAARHGGAAATAASLLSVLTYNFFFTRPYYSLNVYDYHDVITLLLMLVSSVIIGGQTSRLRMQTHFYRRKEQETTLLYAMANHLGAATGSDACLAVLRSHVAEAFHATALLWQPVGNGLVPDPTFAEALPLREQEAARWAHEHGEAAGAGTMTLPGASFRYLPVPGSDAVLAIKPRQDENRFTPQEFAMIASFLSLAQAALGRSAQALLAEERRLEAESEAMRATLLASVSHDFRTPLASVRGAIDGLRLNPSLDEAARGGMLDAAHAEVVRLERVVTHLLDLTQLTTGRLPLKRDFYFLPELVGNALKASGLTHDHRVTTDLPEALPALDVDGLLIEQALINLFENAARHTPPGTAVHVQAAREGNSHLVIDVCDEGPGIPRGAEGHLFESFQPSLRPQGSPGSGLGLAICHAILAAHRGSISLLRRERGAGFRLRLPIGSEPALPAEAP